MESKTLQCSRACSNGLLCGLDITKMPECGACIISKGSAKSDTYEHLLKTANEFTEALILHKLKDIKVETIDKRMTRVNLEFQKCHEKLYRQKKNKLSFYESTVQDECAEENDAFLKCFGHSAWMDRMAQSKDY